MTAAMSPAERLAARSAPGPHGCLLWTGGKTTKGYGCLAVGGRTVAAHRLAYELAKGPIPEGLEIDHTCSVRSCVNPDHLEAVTHRENLLRSSNQVAINASKTHCKNGHEFTPENTLPRGDKHRRCHICKRATQRRYKAARQRREQFDA